MTMKQLDALVFAFGYDAVIDGDEMRAFVYLNDALLYGVRLI